jgi:PAS domain S-box-containing protein
MSDKPTYEELELRIRGLEHIQTERNALAALLEQKLREINSVYFFAQQLATDTTVEKVADAALTAIVDIVRPDLALFFLRKDEELELLRIYPADFPLKFDSSAVHRVGDCLCGVATRSGEPLYSIDIHADRRCTYDECKRAGIRSFAAIPLRSADRILGVIGLASTTTADFETRSSFLAALASGTAIVLKNALLLEGAKKRPAELEREIAERERAERLLLQSEERLRLALKAADQGLYDLNIATGEALVTPEYATMLGYDPAQFHETNAAWIERLHPDDRNSIAETYRDYVAGKIPEYRVEFRQRTKSGDWKWILSLGKIVATDEQGKPLRMLGTHTDITELKLTEQALRESEARYRGIVENAVEGIFQSTPEGHFIRVNPAFAHMLGYGSSEELLSTVSDITRQHYADPEDRRRYQEHLRKYGSVKDFEFRVRRKDGSLIWVSDSTRAVFDPNGMLLRYEGMVKEITERKLAEAERDRLLSAIEQAGEMVVITDPEGIIQYVNPAFETVTGFSRKEAIGQRPSILKSGRQDDAVYKNLWATIAAGRTWKGRMVNKRKDGSFYTEEATISPVCDPAGRIVHFVAVAHDITEHLKLADQLHQSQKMESVGRLAGGVAHDYNNMLSVILGYAELALDKVDPADPLYSDLKEIVDAARRSADITRQLLAFARKQTIIPKVLDLNETVERMLNMLRRLIGEDIDLAWLPEAVLWPVKIDPSQIDQILANLCVNARDAIKGGGNLTIETNKVTLDEAYCADNAGFVPGEFVLLTVSDNGCGMDQETMNKIFEPFFTTKEVGRGTGLGLATVYGIVKQNNGFIHVYSEPGQGTSFRIYLPHYTGDAEELRAESAAITPSGRDERVLLVEDDPSIMRIGQAMLEKLGYRVLAAVTPNEAIGIAEKYAGPIDLLITDVVMPGMNGRELATRMHALHPEINTLFISGYTADVIANHGVLEQGVHFLQKPFSIKDLADQVRATLDSGKNDRDSSYRSKE